MDLGKGKKNEREEGGERIRLDKKTKAERKNKKNMVLIRKGR